MTRVKLASVRTFPHVAPNKAQALKPLEEAAEVFGAWQEVARCRSNGLCGRECSCVDDCGAVENCIDVHNMLDEIADTIQASCNLAAALGVTDLTPYLARCEERNRHRGRYDE